MLVLKRKTGERLGFFVHGGTVAMMELSLDATARLAINAPRDVLVLREEVWNDQQRASIEQLRINGPLPLYAACDAEAA